MKDDMTDEEQEIWSAIRYLDPDEKDKPGSSPAVGMIILAVAVLVCIVLIEFRLRGL